MRTACLLLFFCAFATVICEDEPEIINSKTVEPTETPDANEVTEENGVLVLNTKNFDTVIANNKVVLVEFYAPWCGHCKALAPEYANAAQTLKKNEHPVALAKVDCTVETELGNRFEVQGYPTLKFFKDGIAVDYDGPRQEKGIVKFMKERADPKWQPPPDAVITLTKDNFREITDREELMLVEFYAPRCGHCKRLAPELEKAAQELKQRHEPIVIAKIDATAETELAEEHKVSGFPTMFIYRKGKRSDYQGPREAPGIIDYMITHSGLPTTLYPSINDVKRYVKSNSDEPVILGVFKSEEDPMFKLFIEANNDVRDKYKFGHTFSTEVMKMVGCKKSCFVVAHPEYLVSKYEKRFNIYDKEDATSEELQHHYRVNEVPLVGHFQKHTELRFRKRPLVLVFYDVNFDPEYRSMTQYWRNKVVKVAHKYPDMLFAVAIEENFQDRLKDLSLIETGEDVNVGIYDIEGRRYPMVDEEFSEDSLTEFIEEYKAGNIKPVIKSQAVAPKAKPGKVQVVVGKSFDDIVMDETKEVFIEFYAPWCGHCKAIEDDIIDLAKKYKKEKNIVIAKIDGTGNEAPVQYAASGYPTIYYALPGEKLDPIKLDGQRSPEALNKFIEENSKILKERKKKKEEL